MSSYSQRQFVTVVAENAGCFAIIVLQMCCYYICFVALPQGAAGWSAVCDIF